MGRNENRENPKLRLLLGDCVVRMMEMEEKAVHTVLCDPPYFLHFMGKDWDAVFSEGEVPLGMEEAYLLWFSSMIRVLEHGGTVMAFGGTRTFHRMAAAMEAAGFTDVHLDAWAYGSGFPKSLNVSKAIDKLFGAKRKTKRIEATGGKVLEYGGQNSRPWMEELAKKGYRDAPGDVPATEKAAEWDGWGTALKPAWEPILVGMKP